MENRRYTRTLFLPCLQGQYKIWKNSLLEYCNDVDVIVSFGDLIGCNEHAADNPAKGPNMAALSYTRLYSEYHDRWTQLIGPNEIAALNSPGQWTNNQSTGYLRDSWLDSDRFKVASVDHGVLLTHGGLTYGEWIEIDRPTTAKEAADRLNEKYSGTLNQGKAFRLTGIPNYSANPIWCDPLQELYPSWITQIEDCPFDQAHAESSINNSLGRQLLQNDLSPMSHITDARFTAYGSIVMIGDAQFTAYTLSITGEILNNLPSSDRLRIIQTDD